MAEKHGVRRAFGLIGASIVWPGSAQFMAGNRLIGAIAMTAWAATVTAALSIWWFFQPSREKILQILTNADSLQWARLALVVGVAVWVLLFVDTWRIALAPRLHWWRVGLVSLVNLLVVALVTSTTTLGWNTLSASREVVTKVFKSTKESSPLHGRYNVLLIGADSGAGRMGYRPDSMTIASVNASTGKTVLISLPRNFQGARFKAGSPMLKYYPDGYKCADQTCMLNAIHTYVDSDLGMTVGKQMYPDSSDPGLSATIDAIEGTTGLTINYHILVNMNGLTNLVNSVGGVKLTVRGKIPMFGEDDPVAWRSESDMYLKQGTYVLGGKEALWYARSRYLQSDYVRMARQKCLMNAMLHQLSPQKVLLNAGKIADASSAMLQTDIPAKDLSAFAELSTKSRDLPIASLGIVPPTFDTYDPDDADIAAIKQAISNLLAKSDATAAPKSASHPATTATPTPSASSATAGSNSEKSINTDNLNSAC